MINEVDEERKSQKLESKSSKSDFNKKAMDLDDSFTSEISKIEEQAEILDENCDLDQ